jgi:hypothetical protein
MNHLPVSSCLGEHEKDEVGVPTHFAVLDGIQVHNKQRLQRAMWAMMVRSPTL